MDSYDSSKPKKYIMYLDVTNLYGYAMVQNLPVSDFIFLQNEEIGEIFNLYLQFKHLDFLVQDDTGYIFEVDLNYPLELQDLHIDLPFAPEHIDSKLCPNLRDKKNYKTHIMYLNICLKNGLLIEKIHKILKFKQSKWLAPFIEMNTEIRKNTNNTSEKDQAKLMNNSIFGKSMENILGRPNFKLFGRNDIKKVIKCLRSPNFLKEFVFGEDIILLEMEKKTVIFNKPIYTGFTILEISKYWLYHLIYDVIKPNFKNTCLSYIDTDSCIFETDEDPYLVLKNNENVKPYFDLSVYPENFICYDETNKGKLGTFKDEMASFALKKEKQLNLITEFVALRSKCYSVMTKEKEIRKCKGLKNTHSIQHEDYKNCLLNNVKVNIEQETFRSKNHSLFTVNTKLNSIISYEDTKRIIDKRFDNNIYTVPIGYKF